MAAAASVAAAAHPVDGSATVPARSFAFAIGNGNLSGGPREVADRLGGFDLVVVDGELASADEVAALRADGVTVLGYLSVGTIEKWRSWYPRLKRFRLGAWADWKDEWFADVSKPKLRRVVAGEIAPQLLAKGFDGLFLDNVDMVETRNHADQRDGMRELVMSLATLAHADGRLLFAQNGAGILDRLGLVDALDGWNREGRHLDLRLRPPPLRPPAPGRNPRGAGGAERDGGPWADHDERGLHARRGRRRGGGIGRELCLLRGRNALRGRHRADREAAPRPAADLPARY